MSTEAYQLCDLKRLPRTMVIVAAGFLLLYIPSIYRLATSIWSTDEQGHGPIIFFTSLWLLWDKRSEILSNAASRTPTMLSWCILVAGLVAYALGRSQGVLLLEVGSYILVLSALFLMFLGTRSLYVAWFPFFFMIFMVPLPAPLVDALTQPLKLAVSIATEAILVNLQFPIARTGVILQIGQYQLLVADACSGLNSLFTLEALGLLYLNVIKHSSAMRNLILAVLIVPISFTANVTRVITLTLVTYYFGDEAGQGFVHGFSGMLLFATALMLIVGVDTLLRFGSRKSTNLPA